MADWHKFKGDGQPKQDWELPPAPNWRPFGKEVKPGESRRQKRADTFQVRPEEIDMVNAALYLRRPLLITGKPGTGKSSLAYAVAKELTLGEVLYWSITTRTTLKDGLYNYDAIARLQRLQEVKQQQGELSEELKQELQTKSIENYITLGPLGTALLPSDKPRVLLIDEIDKSDIDLPNDLLTIFEEGRFEIPELVRLKQAVKTFNVRTAYTADTDKIHEIIDGEIICSNFPLIFLTSNFPAPFLRRCLRLSMKEPDKTHLVKIINAHLQLETETKQDDNSKDTKPEKLKLKDSDLDKLVDKFIEKREYETLANDQLLNALFMVTNHRDEDKTELIEKILQDLGEVAENE
jgi:MoxR-like ATPase